MMRHGLQGCCCTCSHQDLWGLGQYEVVVSILVGGLALLEPKVLVHFKGVW